MEVFPLSLFQQFKHTQKKINGQSQNSTNMLNSSAHRIPPGVVDKSVEFFAFQNNIFCMCDGQRIVFEDFPKWITEIVERDMLDHPEALKALAQWENLHPDEYMRQYIYCRFGGHDYDADIDTAGRMQYTEYNECGIRGKCKFEGKLCCSIKAEHGIITKAELEVLKRVALLDKEIADELNISTDTVNTHFQNLRQKTGLANKTQLGIYANQKGIVLYERKIHNNGSN